MKNTKVSSSENDLLLGKSLVDSANKTTEKDLVLPVLLAAAKADQIGLQGVTSEQLYRAIVPLVNLSPDDLSQGRRDRKTVSALQQTFWNSFSHGLFDGLLDKVEFEQAGKKTKGYRVTPDGCARLLQELLSDAPELRNDEVLTVVPGGARIMEDMVARQILLRLAELQSGENAKPVSITALRKDVKAELPLSLMDIQILKDRSDTRIDQVIRNIISHNTLTKSKLVERDARGLMITRDGLELALHMILKNVPVPNFGISPTPRVEFQESVDLTLAQEAEKVQERRARVPRR